MAGRAATAAVSTRAIRVTPMAPGANTGKAAATAAIGIVTGTPGTAIAIAIRARAADPSASPSAASPIVANPVSSRRTLPPARTPALRRRARRARIARSAPTVRNAAGVVAVAAVAAGAAGAVVHARAASDRLREVPAHPSASRNAKR